MQSLFSQSRTGARQEENGIPVEVIRGTQHSLKGEIDEALRWYQAAVRQHPTSPWSYFGLAETLLAFKQSHAALRAYGKALQFEQGLARTGEIQGTRKTEGGGSEGLRLRLVGRCTELVESLLRSTEIRLNQEDRALHWMAFSDVENLERSLLDVVHVVPEIGRSVLGLKRQILEKLFAPGMAEPDMARMLFAVEKKIFDGLNKVLLDPSLLDKIERIDWEKRRFDKYYAEILDYVPKYVQSLEILKHNHNSDWSEQVKKTVVGRLKPDDFNPFLLNSCNGKFPLSNVGSFVGSTVIRERKKQLRGRLPGDELLRKDRAYRFVKSLGCRIPFQGDRVLSLAEIEPQEEVVIKPLSEANCRGTYMVKKGYKILNLARREPVQDWPGLMASLQEDLRQGTVEADQWIVQELIYEDREKTRPARDLRFFCFYGRVGMIWETFLFPEKRFCSWNAHSELIEPGVLQDRTRFLGEGVTREQVEFAASMSAKIPIPFIRIDFLKGWQGLVFCEFALLPGPYRGIKDWLNRALGDYFLDAEGRLMEDLLEGKRFEEYWRFRGELRGDIVSADLSGI